MTLHSRSFSCEKENLPSIREFATDTLFSFKIPRKELNLIVLAVEEVCANLIIHSHNCNPEDQLDILIKFLDGELSCEITDKGTCFNINEHKEPSINEVIKLKKTGGIGLILVKKIMDRIEVEMQNGKNIYRFFKAFAIPAA